MGETPVVSVIMSTCGQQKVEYLKTAVESVLSQENVDLELIVCNDGSENSEKEHFEYLRKLAKKDKRIRLVDNPESRGLAYALNLCIGMARGKYLARMDDDDVCEAGRLKIQADYLDEHLEIDFVGCNAKLIDEKGIWGHRQMPEEPGKKDFLKFSPYIHPAVMFRKDIFDKQEAYRIETRRGEDYELFMRLSAAGVKGYNLQKELLAYREDRKSYKRRKWGSRIDEVKIRYHGFSALGLMLPWGWLYVMRPLAAECIPIPLIYGAKRLYHEHRNAHGKMASQPLHAGNTVIMPCERGRLEKWKKFSRRDRIEWNERKIADVPQGTWKSPDTVSGVGKIS